MSHDEDAAGHELRALTTPAEGVPEVIDSERALAVYVDALAAGTGPVAVDAERASGFRYGQRAYLVQVRRNGAGTALIDPIAVPDLSSVSDALRGTEWVLHAANQDLACLAEVGMTPDALFDTELAGRLLGLPRVGLGPIVAAELGLSLAKEHSAADWSTRPFPDSWLRYAALDVEVLVDLRDVLHAKLAEQGKLDWALEEFENVRLTPPPGPKPEVWRRGTHVIRDQRGLAVVRELWRAREQAAERADIAPGRVLPEAAMVAAGLAKPTSRERLARLREFKARGAARRLDLWADAVARAMDLPEADLPPRRVRAEPGTMPPPRAWRDRHPEAAVRLEVVKSVIRGRAEELGLPQENLLTPEYQRRIAWAPPTPATPEGLTDALRGLGARRWQVMLVAEPLATGFSDPDSVLAEEPTEGEAGRAEVDGPPDAD